MNCIICKADISEPWKQCGDTTYPMCVSCWLGDNAWVYNDKQILFELAHGATLDVAAEVALEKEKTELQLFAEDFWTAIAEME